MVTAKPLQSGSDPLLTFLGGVLPTLIFIGLYMPSGELSQHTLELIDGEVKRIISECAEEAKRQLAEHREQLDHLAQTLLERETLDEADAYAVAGITEHAAPSEPVPVTA